MIENKCEYKTNHSFLISNLEQNGSATTTVFESDNQETACCEYISNRTRIRCASVRPVKDFNSFGYCEKVYYYYIFNL